MNNISQISWIEPEQINTAKHINSYFHNLLQLFNINDTVARWPDLFGEGLYSWTKHALHTPIRILSLFSGGGGLDIAFHDANFHAIQMIELETRYVETLKANARRGQKFEGTEPLCIDIRDFRPADDLHVDFIIGGPPCQTFSAAGRRAAGVSGLDDPRGRLFQEYVRLLDELKPKGFLFENVYGIIGAQGGKAWQEILSTFESLGYTISYRILDAADYGVPQHRERLIIVGVKNRKFAFPRPTHGLDSVDNRPYYTPRVAIQDVLDEKPKVVGGRYGHLLADIPPGLNYSFYTEEMGHPHPHFAWRSKFSDLLYKADENMPIRTLKAQGGQYTGPFHWENRPFSIGELKRLQTFPDDYVLIGGKQLAIQQIGNSVPPQLGRILAIAVLQQVFDVQFPFEIDYLSPEEELTFRQRKAQLTALYREKAKEAIARLYQSTTIETRQTLSFVQLPQNTTTTSEQIAEYIAYLSPTFSWHIKGSNSPDYPWNAEFTINMTKDTLQISLREILALTKNPSTEIEISPTHKWGLPVNKVHLTTQGTLFMGTATWKAFEYYIIRENIKADLVQLNGYYQYEPKIKMEVLKFAPTEERTQWHWEVLRYVLEGKGVKQILSLEEMAEKWQLSVTETVKALLELKSLGYEVRSEYTNNQIPKGHVLIPYAFPTFNKNSVQLKKLLFPADFVPSQRITSQRKIATNEGLWNIENL